MNPFEIIDKYYKENPEAKEILLSHVKKVAEKAVSIAKKLKERGIDINVDLVYSGAILHDIGVIYTNAPAIKCFGKEHYLRHGIIGGEILRKEGLGQEALIAERHIGVGISKQDIEENNLPLPPQDFIPETLEEQIVAYSDKFFSKSNVGIKHSVEEIISELANFGEDKVARFLEWHSIFGKLK